MKKVSLCFLLSCWQPAVPRGLGGTPHSLPGRESGTLSFTATATRYEVISGICTTFTHTGVVSGIHESDWNATTKTKGDLIDIANQYAAEYPGKRLKFNDISLPMGGKFDGNSGRWTGGHSEHTRGRNCDISKSGMSAEERDRVRVIIIENGGADGPGGIYDHSTHWHTRHWR